MRENAQFSNHVQPPDDIRFLFPLVLLIRHTDIDPVAQPFRGGADDLATVAAIPDAISLSDRRRADAFLRPVLHPAGRQLIVNRLPEELSIALAEAHQHALVPR